MLTPKLVNARDLRRQYELEPEKCVAELRENLDKGRLRPENLSIRDLFEALVDGGRELVYLMSRRKSGNLSVRELREAGAGSVGGTADFSNITGQIVYTVIREKYEDPQLLWPRLATTQMTEFLDGERIPGIGRLGDKAEKIEEGAEYPLIGANEEWTDSPRTVKHGFRAECTREIVIADRTGLYLERIAEGARWCSVLVEKETIDVATGQINNYNRNGVSSNTYLTTGAYVNSQTGNALKWSGNEWLALESADLLFDALTDPNTGEPIGIPSSPQLLVPSALLRTAQRIVRATDVETVDMRANATTVRTVGPNPYADRKPEILSNQYVKARTGSTTQWFYGDFRRAIKKMTIWEIETQQAADNNEAMFLRDVWVRHKAGYRSVVFMYEPRFLTKNDQ